MRARGLDGAPVRRESAVKFLRASRPVLLGLVLVGCTVGPDFRQPRPWAPNDFAALHRHVPAGPPAASLPVPAPPDPAWWNIFGDRELSAIEARIARSNLSVREATYRLAQSRAQRQVTAAALYPSLNGTSSYMYEKLPNRLVQRGLDQALKGINPQSIGGVPLTAGDLAAAHAYAGEARIPPVDLWQDAIDASYQVDLWGSVRRSVEAAAAQVEQSADARRSSLISAEAEAARDYVQLRSLQAQLAIQNSNAQSDAHTLILTQQRYTGGLTTDLDVENARAQLASTQSAIPTLNSQVSEQINALSLLLGEPPQALASELETSAPVPPVPPLVPVGLPSDLVLRRPDVRQAAAALHAATAEIGVAIAAFYPQVTLTGNLDEISLQFRDLFTWESHGFSLGPSITLPLFSGGRLRGQLRLDRAEQAEAAVSYEQAVLQAWHDVDNALTAYAAEQLRRDRLRTSVEAAQRALTLAGDQYAHGLVNFLNVLDAQRTLLTAQQQLVGSTANVSSDLVQLYTALGGGWEEVFPAAGGYPDHIETASAAKSTAVP